jgi:hypothetical protein
MVDPDETGSRLLEAVQLPEGVTPEDWAAEKAQWQNPRIRALLGCSRILDSVLESNQAILNCAPERLVEIWNAVREVARLLDEEVVPLLEGPSVIVRLEDARLRTRAAALVLTSTVVAEIERMPAEIEEERSKEFRKLLCVSLGQLHDFLQDAFADLMANDPRSFHDSGYFLSRRFRRDVEEAEWLIATVNTLQTQLDDFEPRRQRDLGALLELFARANRTLPEPADLGPMVALLEALVAQLTPRLKEAVALRGIRFAELEVVDRWSAELPTHCRVLLELWDLAARARRGGAAAESVWEREIVSRSLGLLEDLDGLLKDLRAFLPLWQRGISNRRALVFRRAEGSERPG